MGRDSIYTQELADKICNAIATSSEGLRRLCKQDESLPAVTTIMRWLDTNVEFREQYARAREAQAEFMVDETIEIADDGTNDYYKNSKGEVLFDAEHVQRSRLRVDTRKWVASKLAPKKYGDKMDVTTNGKDVNAPNLSHLSIDELIRLRDGHITGDQSGNSKA